MHARSALAERRNCSFCTRTKIVGGCCKKSFEKLEYPTLDFISPTDARYCNSSGTKEFQRLYRNAKSIADGIIFVLEPEGRDPAEIFDTFDRFLEQR
jgi:hypothetical protein